MRLGKGFAGDGAVLLVAVNTYDTQFDVRGSPAPTSYYVGSPPNAAVIWSH